MSTEEQFSYFVDASFGSIYPALSRLQDDGCVTVREEHESGKPPRKIYSITDKGRLELIEALHVIPRRDTFKSEFLLMALCSELLDRETIERAIERRIREQEVKLDVLAAAVADCSQCTAGIKWIAEYGKAVTEASLRHLLEHRDELINLVPEKPSEAAE